MSEENQEKSSVERVVYGYVVSDKMDKTLTVKIERRLRHGLYNKYIRRSTKIKVHDAENTARMGDLVSIRSCRPLSRHKSFTLVEVVERATVMSAAS